MIYKNLLELRFYVSETAEAGGSQWAKSRSCAVGAGRLGEAGPDPATGMPNMCWLDGRLEQLAMSRWAAGADPLEALLLDEEFVEGLEWAYPELLALKEAENLSSALKRGKSCGASPRKL